MTEPTLWNADVLVRIARENQAGLPDGRWVAARPLAFPRDPIRGTWHRLRLAWLVFTGRCDALQWTGQ